MQKYMLILLMFCTLQTHAIIRGKVVDAKGVPIPDTNIKWLTTDIGTTSDKNGRFALPETNVTKQILVSNVAYLPDTVSVQNTGNELVIVLNDKLQLTELNVTAVNASTLKLRSAMFNTEKITAAELCKAACCNLSESFETNPSVDVSYSDAATGAKHIKLLGLPGSYVQMLTENIPNLRGISAPYGLSFIPGPWMESIQVSKGTASVINGYEAVTGQINVEYKKPQTSEKVAVNVFASDAGRFESNVNASAILNKKLSTGILLHASNEFELQDDNHDKFADMPAVKQYNFINRWYYKSDKFISQVFVRALNETRTGGQIQGPYKIEIQTERYEVFLKNGYIFNPETGTSIALILNGSDHTQHANYGSKHYKGLQDNLFANLLFQTQWTEKHKLTTGVSMNYDRYDEFISVLPANSLVRSEQVTGIYGEYTLKVNDKLNMLTGLRYDFNSVYGSLLTPRLHLKYHPTEHVSFRATAGRGYKSPQILAEYNYMLTGNRSLDIATDLTLEKAWNYGLSTMADLHVGSKTIKLNAEWFYTNFDAQVIADMDSDPHKISFYNLDGKSYSHSTQVDLSTEIVTGLTVNIAHRVNIVKATIGGVLRDKPLTNKSKSLLTLSYQTPLKKWQFDYTAQFNGGGRLPDPDQINPLWHKTFAPYTVMNAQITKYFKTWSVYLGGENLTNFMQHNPIIDVQNPQSANFDASMIWGPLHGRKLYIGMRWGINRE